MLLAIDIDNRTTDFGVFDQEKLVDKFSITTDRNRSVAVSYTHLTLPTKRIV